jgi:hypothetical protein
MKSREEDSNFAKNRQYFQEVDDDERRREDSDADINDNETDSYSKVTVRRERRR